MKTKLLFGLLTGLMFLSFNETEAQTYCTPTTRSTQYAGIGRVTLNTIDNNTSSNNGYTFFNNISTNLTPGNQYTLSVYPISGRFYYQFVTAWIDYNGNGVFESNERIVNNVSLNFSSPSSASFTVPSSVTATTTRMRVRTNFGGASINDPCRNLNLGETEDYVINLGSSTVAAPSITCPSDIVVNNDAGQCGAAVNFAATETTGIPASTITYSVAPGTLFNTGTTAVTATATNSAGTSSCTFNVTVNDTENPTVLTQNITVQLDANGAATITPQQIDNGSSDNCGPVTLSLDAGQGNFTCANVGQTNTVTLAVTDANGNTATGTANVTVQDVTPPTVVTQNITVQLDATGNASIVAADIDNGSNDVCGIASMTLDAGQGNFTCANVGQTNTVTLAVTDVNGNTATGTANVTVVDVTAPTVVTQNVTVQLDATGVASVTGQQFDGGSTDACGVASYALSIPRGGTIDPNNLTCADVGTHNVTLIVTDVNGNASQATATVTVQDVTAPAVVTQNVTVQLDANGTAGVTAQQFDGGSTDACGIATYALSIPRGGTIDPNNLTCADVGTHNVTLIVTDVNGNAAQATATVTVQDTTAPTVVTQAFTTTITGGVATITPQDVDGGSFDNCGIESMSVSPTTFVCGDQGNHTVTLTVTDNNGNTSTSTAIVTVVGEVPTISIDTFTAVPTQNTNTVYLGYGPQSVTLSTQTTGGTGFTYNWTSSTGELVSSVANPTISPLVTTTYTVTVTNANGCEATTSIEVCVIDARAIDDEGKYEGKVLLCKGNSDDDDDKDYSSKDDDDDDDDSHGPKTKEVKSKKVEKYLNKGYTLGACNATCTTTYVEVVLDSDDDDHSSDDHADSDDDKDDNDHADNDDSSSDDDKSDKDDDDNNNNSRSRSGKVKVILYPNPVVDKVVISLNTKKKDKGEIKVFDYSGRKIFGKKVKDLKKGVGFNMERYNSGTYFVKIKYKGKVYTAIIFKER
jgi:uncharacterized UPF0146 family protein